MAPLEFDEEYSGSILPAPKATRLLPSWSRQKPSRWNFITTIFYIFLGFLWGSYWAPSLTSIRSDNGAFKTAATIFEINETFTQSPELGSDEAWSSLIPMRRGGYIAVDSNEKPIPYTGQEVALSDVRAISVFHQIHCLNMLRVAYFASQNTSTTTNTNTNTAHNHETHTHAHHDHSHTSDSHLLHCFDYLRQALMCSADTTLETLRASTLDTNPGVDGWGATHQCRDYGEVMEWATVHRTGDNGGTA